MAPHHFAKFMASPQFNHQQACDKNCKIEHKNKKTISKLEKLIRRMVEK
jgi:hypothetical protein